MAELTREQIRQIGITSEKVMSLYEECKCPGDATLCFSDRVLNAMLEISARCLSAPAPQQTAPEQQELIARLLDSGHDLGCGMINKRNYAFVRVCNCTLLARKQAADALSRSLEDGRRAGLPSEHWLSEAAFHLDLQKEIACVTPYSTVGQMIRHIVEKAHELRLLKTPKGGA